MKRLPWVLTGLVAACGVPQNEEPLPEQPGDTSSNLAFADDGQTLVAADADDHALIVANVRTNAVIVEDIDGYPGHVAWRGSTVFVSVRDRREVVVFRFDGRRLHLQSTFQVGAEPDGLLFDAPRQRLFVACETERAVYVLNPDSGEVLDVVGVDIAPRWLGRSQGQLFVTGPSRWMAIVDIDTGSQSLLDLQSESTPFFDIQASGAAAAYGDSLWVAASLANTMTPQRSSDQPYYAERARVQGAAVLFARGEDGEYQHAWSLRLPVAGTDAIGFGPGGDVIITAAKDGVALQIENAYKEQPWGFAVLQTGAGARGLANNETHRFVFSAIDRQIFELGKPDLSTYLPITSDISTTANRRQRTAARTFRVPQSRLPDNVQRGRQLFESATHEETSAPGSLVACASCHPDGKTDGRTWPLVAGPRQTPSLAGLGVHGPFGWTGSQPTIADDALFTGRELMGGDLSPEDAAAIESYIATLRRTDHPRLGVVDPASQRGHRTFDRLGCASCHAQTPGRAVIDLGEQRFIAPRLQTLSDTAPYLHDGRAKNLFELLQQHPAGPFALPEGEAQDLVQYLRTL